MTTEQKIDKILMYIEGDESLGIKGAVNKQTDTDERLKRLEDLVTRVTSVPFLGGVFVGLCGGVLLLVELIGKIKDLLHHA